MIVAFCVQFWVIWVPKCCWHRLGVSPCSVVQGVLAMGSEMVGCLALRLGGSSRGVVIDVSDRIGVVVV